MHGSSFLLTRYCCPLVPANRSQSPQWSSTACPCHRPSQHHPLPRFRPPKRTDSACLAVWAMATGPAISNGYSSSRNATTRWNGVLLFAPDCWLWLWTCFAMANWSPAMAPDRIVSHRRWSSLEIDGVLENFLYSNEKRNDVTSSDGVPRKPKTFAGHHRTAV